MDILNMVMKRLKNFLSAFEVKVHLKNPTLTRNFNHKWRSDFHFFTFPAVYFNRRVV